MIPTKSGTSVVSVVPAPTFSFPPARGDLGTATTPTTHTTPLDPAEDGTTWAIDAAELDPRACLIALTGYWCPICHLPRVPYPGGHGRHATLNDLAWTPHGSL